MPDTPNEGQRTDIPTGAIAYFVAYMFLMWFWDFIVGIPKTIANWFVTDPVKDNMMPMVNKPKQTPPDFNDRPFYGNRKSWTDIFYHPAIAMLCIVLFLCAYILLYIFVIPLTY